MKPIYKRVKTPNLLQMEAVECGAASLAIVLGYHGNFVPLEVLRTDCDVSRDGSKASNIVKAGRMHGLEAKGYRRDLEDLYAEKFPFIVHWNFNHFLVVEGIGKDKVFLNDPAAGHRTVKMEEFSDAFTGVVLCFDKGPDFKKVGKESSLLGALATRLDGMKMALTYIILLGILLVVPGLVVPVFSRIFIDDILIKGSHDWFMPLIVGMIVTSMIQNIMRWMRSHYLLKARSKLALTTSANFFWHILRLPINFFNQRYSGEIGSRVGLNNGVASLLTGQLASNFLDVLFVFFYFAMMLQYDEVLSFLVLGISLINIASVRFVSSQRIEGYRIFSQLVGKLTGVSMGGLQIIETIKATGRENDFFVKWASYMTKVVNSAQKLASLSIMLSTIPALLNAISSITILVVGSNRVMEGHLTIGMLVAFQSLMGSFIGPVNSLISLGSTLQEAESDMGRLDDILNSKIDPETERALPVKVRNYEAISKKLDGYIEFKNINFGYSKLSEPLIKDFSLKINPGERVAIVGGSGSGKSTIAKLIAGIYEPWSGDILFDGQKRKEIPKQMINNSLAMVDQDIFIFEGTVREVITLWDETISVPMVVKAAKDAEIHELIVSKKDGYDYMVNEGGKNFSGGQRQRLEIARSLAINPSILVLDEATSALDPTTEKIIDDNIKKRKCSVLVVAHRLSTIRDSNEIIVMNKGVIVERGTHDELVKMKGEYWQLIKS